MISLQFWQALLTALLPVFSTIVAGAIRQDKAAPWVNDFISFVTPLVAGVANTVASGAPQNANGLLFLAISTLTANLAHTPFLFGIQQALQSRLLSFGVRPEQVQAVEQVALTHMPQIEALLLQLIDEVRGKSVQVATTVPIAAAAQPAPVQLMPNPAFSATTTAVVPQLTIVPQQPFPAPAFDWTGIVPTVKP